VMSGRFASRRRVLVITTAAALCLFVVHLTGSSSQAPSSCVDAIIVPGGGSQRDATPQSLPLFVRHRLDRALDRWVECAAMTQLGALRYPRIIVLSLGTVHQPNYINSAGWPVAEATSEALYLLNASADRGLKDFTPDMVLREALSLDTLGNAFFTRLLHTDVVGLRRLHVITSAFHFVRTRALFEFVFGARQHDSTYERSESETKPERYAMSYEATMNAVTEDVKAKRFAREQASIDALRTNLAQNFGLNQSFPPATDAPDPAVHATKRIHDFEVSHPQNTATLAMLHRFVWTKHEAYKTSMRMAGTGVIEKIPAELLDTY